MIRAYKGLNGDGKSYSACGDVVRRCVESRSFVVTSLPLNLDRLRERVVRLRGEKAPAWDMDKFLRVITKADAVEFWRFRSGGLVLAQSPDRRREGDRNMSAKRIPKDEHDAWMDAEMQKMLANAEYMMPVDYFIDEAHNIFSSREWATSGRGTLYYASQHRHADDNVTLITSAFDQVEKQMRDLVAEVDVCRNFAKRSVGPFRMRPVIKVKSYYGHQTDRVLPYATRNVYIDPEGVGACYQTTGALGLRAGPERHENKGVLPWWSAGILGAGVVAAAIALVGFGPRSLVNLVFGHRKAQVESSSTGGRAAQQQTQSTPEPLKPLIVLCDGVSGFSDRSVLVHVPSLGDWETGVEVMRGIYKLDNGVYARFETVPEKLKRVHERDQESKDYDEAHANQPEHLSAAKG